LGVQPDVAFYDSRVGRFVSLVLREPMIPGTGKGNTLRWEGLGRPSATMIQDRTWTAVMGWLQHHNGELRLNLGDLGPPRIAVPEKGQLVYVRIPRVVNGVLVRASTMGITINHGNMVLLGLQNWGLVDTAVAPSITQDRARSVTTEHAAPYRVAFG